MKKFYQDDNGRTFDTPDNISNNAGRSIFPQYQLKEITYMWYGQILPLAMVIYPFQRAMIMARHLVLQVISVTIPEFRNFYKLVIVVPPKLFFSTVKHLFLYFYMLFD